MPTYKAKAYLVKNGEVIQEGDEIELTKEQADRLGDKVEAPTGDYEQPLEEFTVAELRDFADKKDIEGYYDMRKAELVEALKEAEKE